MVSRRTVQIRNVPDDVYRRLKSRSASAGVSLSEYLLAEMLRLLERPTRQQLLERLEGRTAVRVRKTPAQMVRSERQS
jgi:plasmid stability protein